MRCFRCRQPEYNAMRLSCRLTAWFLLGCFFMLIIPWTQSAAATSRKKSSSAKMSGIRTINGNYTVSGAGTVLSNTVITGSLCLSEKIGAGDCTLSNVTVRGKTFIQGGGARSVRISNSTLPVIEVKKRNNSPVRLVASGRSSIGAVMGYSPVILTETGLSGVGFTNARLMAPGGPENTLAGTFQQVEIAADKGGLVLTSGRIAALTTQAVDTAVRIQSGTVQAFTIPPEAVNTYLTVAGAGRIAGFNAAARATVKNQGSIQKADVSGEGTTIEMGYSGLIHKLVLDAPALVTGQGTIHNLELGASGSNITQSVPNITVKPGVVSTVAGIMAQTQTTAPALVPDMIETAQTPASSAGDPFAAAEEQYSYQTGQTAAGSSGSSPVFGAITIEADKAKRLTIQKIPQQAVYAGKTRDIPVNDTVKNTTIQAVTSNGSTVRCAMAGGKLRLTGIKAGKTTVVLHVSKKGFTGANTVIQVLVQELPGRTLTFSSRVLYESTSNDGSIDRYRPITVTVAGDSFSGVMNEDFAANGKVAVTNLPGGFTASVTRQSAAAVQIILNGKAAYHGSVNNVSNIGVQFADSAFTYGSSMIRSAKTNDTIGIQFIDDGLTYSSTVFREVYWNDGSIDNETPILIMLHGSSFSGVNDEDFVANGKIIPIGMPDGLRTEIKRDSATQLSVKLLGTALVHRKDNSTEKLGFLFQNSAFAGGGASSINNYDKANLEIRFYDPEMTYSNLIFRESAANDGTISTDSTITVLLAGDTFTGADGDDFISLGYVTVTGVPYGLTPTAKRVSPRAILLSLTGTAKAHRAADSASLSVQFSSSVFSGGHADQVRNYVNSNLSVSFMNPSITYSNTVFPESADNDGSIDSDQPVVITLTGDTVNGAVYEDFIGSGKAVFANLPAGLTPMVLVTNRNTLAIGFLGNAVAHRASDSVNNVVLTLNSSAFTGGNADKVDNAVKSNLSVRFIDPVLTYSAQGFAESGTNNGSINNTSPMVITLAGDTFTGVNGENLIANGKAIAANVPTGLTAVVMRASEKTVRVSLTGTATAHQAANSITNMGLSFTDSAFTGNNAALVGGSSAANLSVTFANPSLNYSKVTMVETSANRGAIDNTVPLKITLSGDTFTGSDGDDFVSNGKIAVTNLPIGLTVTAERTSTTQITVLFNGNATLHSAPYRVTDLGFAFQSNAFTLNDASIVGNGRVSDLSLYFIN